MKRAASSAGKALRWLALLAAVSPVGCLFSRTVEFRSDDTEQLISGATLAEVPGEMRMGNGAIGVFLIATDGGFRIELPLFFDDFHDELTVKRVSMVSPMPAEAMLLDEARWEEFEPPIGNAFGSLRVAEIQGAPGSAIPDSSEVVLEVELDFSGQDRVVTFRLERIVEWWPPNT